MYDPFTHSFFPCEPSFSTAAPAPPTGDEHSGNQNGRPSQYIYPWPPYYDPPVEPSPALDGSAPAHYVRPSAYSPGCQQPPMHLRLDGRCPICNHAHPGELGGDMSMQFALGHGAPPHTIPANTSLASDVVVAGGSHVQVAGPGAAASSVGPYGFSHALDERVLPAVSRPPRAVLVPLSLPPSSGAERSRREPHGQATQRKPYCVPPSRPSGGSLARPRRGLNVEARVPESAGFLPPNAHITEIPNPLPAGMEVLPQNEYAQGARRRDVQPEYVNYYGFSLAAAAARRFGGLRDPTAYAFAGSKNGLPRPKMTLRFEPNVPGEDWKPFEGKQRTLPGGKKGATRAQLAAHVADQLAAYLVRNPCRYAGRAVGLDDLFLFYVKRVSQGSFQAEIGIKLREQPRESGEADTLR